MTLVDKVRELERSLPPAPEGWQFNAATWIDSFPSGNHCQVGETLIRRGDHWVSERGNVFATVADYLATWHNPYAGAVRCIEAFYGHHPDDPINVIFGRSGGDYVPRCAWWNIKERIFRIFAASPSNEQVPLVRYLNGTHDDELIRIAEVFGIIVREMKFTDGELVSVAIVKKLRGDDDVQQFLGSPGHGKFTATVVV